MRFSSTLLGLGLALTSVAVIAACGSTHKTVPSPTSTPSPFPTVSCSDVSGTCSALEISSGQFDSGCGVIDCGRTRYAASLLGPNPGGPAMLDTPEGLVVVYTDQNLQLHLAHELADAGFSDENLGVTAYGAGPGGSPPQIQRTSDGRLWVAAARSYIPQTAGVMVGASLSTPYPDGGHFAWTTFAVAGPLFGFAVDGAGKVHFGYAYRAFNASNTQYVGHYEHHAVGDMADGGLTDEIVESVTADGGQMPFLGAPTLVADAQGDVHMFYLLSGSDGGAHHVQVTSSGNVLESLGTPNRAFTIYARPAAAVDGSGKLHVAWSNADSQLKYAVQTSGGWQVTDIPIRVGAERQALALDAQGQPSILSGDVDSMSLSEERMGYWPSEWVSNCSSGNVQGMALAFDSTGALRIAYTCANQPNYDVRVLRRIGNYPAGYATLCTQTAADLCAKGCGCAADGGTQCDYFGTNANGQYSRGVMPEFCPQYTAAKVCGDATQDPSVVQSCNQITGTLSCGTDPQGNPGADLGTSVCTPFFN